MAVRPDSPFGARLRTALDERGPLCAGIDPHTALLAQWDLSDDVAGLERFAYTVVEALADRVAALKPQSAFFERYGSRGIAVLERVVDDARSAGTVLIMDAKRGDIGSTVAAYADAYLVPSSPLFSDALTANPYLGFGSLEPLYAAAEKNNAGVFVLGLTSNPEGSQVQGATGASGRTVAEEMITAAAVRNAGASPMGPIGVVVGGTVETPDFDLAQLNGAYLVPGIGAQGATPADVRRIFGAGAHNVVPSNSREILRGGPSIAGLRDAAARAVDELRGMLD
ncbi:orotidine-5'-phosphate decarboxylase [Catenulispora sp. MAP5-51]|uniref:orotidine-5'-phosphate decarboxylase n=1 Tax=Catenulispora sp. MAP5-51 TaxID=3156298 RepID=UPI0035143166